jgi:hypothetical protein
MSAPGVALPRARKIQLVGIEGGKELTKIEEENLESNGYIFARSSGNMPARFINGVQIFIWLNKLSREMQTDAQWGIVRTDDGEFIVPDTPSNQFMPIAPRLALATPTPGGLITFETLVNVNRISIKNSQRYFFAHDISKCPY